MSSDGDEASQGDLNELPPNDLRNILQRLIRIRRSLRRTLVATDDDDVENFDEESSSSDSSTTSQVSTETLDGEDDFGDDHLADFFSRLDYLIDDYEEDFVNIDYSSLIMKVDKSRFKKGATEVSQECQELIGRLCTCSRAELLDELAAISTWTFGKCELYHWHAVLDTFDDILQEACTQAENKWSLYCDTHYSNREKKLLLWCLHFTTLLIEHSFSRHLYNSMEHLLGLLGSSDMGVVLAVLNLLYMFSKRSNFITRMAAESRTCLVNRLQYLAESWGGKENGFGLAECCDYRRPVPSSATTIHLELHKFNSKEHREFRHKTNTEYIHVEHVDQLHKKASELMVGLTSLYAIPLEKEMQLFTQVRLALNFSNYRTRLQCVLARLQALSVLVYSNSLQESAHTLLYNGLLEELVELIEMKEPHLVEIRAAALRTLTSIIHLDRNPHFPKKPGSRLAGIIDVTGANQYHGFLPVLVRNCITSLTKQTAMKDQATNTPYSPIPGTSHEDECPYSITDFISDVGILAQIRCDLNNEFPLPLATALFSFLYHLASYEIGGEALVSCGMMESLLQVINWHGVELEHITFVTRAVRVIDLITNIDMHAFQAHGGLDSFINRLEVEVSFCLREHVYDFRTIVQDAQSVNSGEGGNGQYEEESLGMEFQVYPGNVGKSCLPQRAALLKSMLNFLKKALQDSTFAESIRHLMEGSLPQSLKHIISNAEYYGPSLFLLATDVVTVYVFQEPSLLSALQDNGLTDVVLHALLIKDVPATREVLSSLPHVFTALCLNNRGLQAFVKCKPFERLFKVLLSPNYLPAMRRRRSADPLGDTASNLGNAMDELMRHQPSLKVDATTAIIKLMQDLCNYGTDPKYVCWRPHSKQDSSSQNNASRPTTNNEGSSDEEDEEEEEASTSSQNQTESQVQIPETERTPIALIDYIHNVMKFVDAILSNNSTDDHCREFVSQGGLVPLLKVLGLPNLPVDCPVTTSAQAVASVCKSILNLAQEPKVLEEGLIQLNEVLKLLRPLYTHSATPKSSKLLQELVASTNLEVAFSTPSATPLLHAMGAAHGYVLMFVHVCRTGQNDIRTTSLHYWGADLGLSVLKSLAELYTSLVWESTLLLALCSDDVIPTDSEFGREDMEKLRAALFHREKSVSPTTVGPSDAPGPSSSTMEHTPTNPQMDALRQHPVASTSHHIPHPGPCQLAMDLDVISVNSVSSSKTDYSGTSTVCLNPRPSAQQIGYIKPLLGASSRLGRALAELFGLLVKLCVGSPTRMRRGQNVMTTPHLTTPFARNVATALNQLLARGLNCKALPPSPIPKFRLTFLICSVGFTSPMLFDEKKYPYHLMLQKFVALGGQAAFFNTFRWALSAGDTVPLEEGLESKNLPDGTGEFLDVWLVLLEKMVNPKAILESPHVVNTKQPGNNMQPFDPLKYLIRIHKLAFEAVMYMWGKAPLRNYGLRMTESILSILKHILRGERIIRERLSKPSESKNETSVATGPTAGPSTSNATEVIDVSINSENLQQLMDMGFTHEHSIEALTQTSNIEQATEYLLSNRDLALNQMDVELSEDDQMMQAIAMSLGDPSTSNTEPAEKEPKKEQPTEDLRPLSEELIDNFSLSALHVCLKLIETLPECIHKAGDLLITIMKRNGPTFRDNMLDRILAEICHNARHVIVAMEKATSGDSVFASLNYTEVLHMEHTLRLGHYTHLYTLFFEIPTYFDMRIPCGFALHRAKVIPFCVKLISLAQELMLKTKKTDEPRWLTPVLLLIDSYCKVALCTQRKREMHLVTRRFWKWFDIVTGKWTPYSPNNNTIINEAYWNGEQSVRITCGRRRYTIMFTNMMQMNDESGNNRPITMIPVNLIRDYCTDITKEVNEKDEDSTTILTDREKKRCIPVPHLPDEVLERVMRDCLLFMQLQIDKNFLHAIMRVCVRLTRNFNYARMFVHGGGVRAMMKLRQHSAFPGHEVLSTILIRHTLEEPNTLAYAMEKALRARTLVSIPPPYKELMYLTRQIGGAVTRAPDIFFKVAKDIARIDYSVYGRGDDVDTRLPLRCDSALRPPSPPSDDEICMSVIRDLLTALLLPLEYDIADNTTSSYTTRSSSDSNSNSNTSPASESVYRRASDLLTAGPSTDEMFQESNDSPPRSGLKSTFTVKEPVDQDLMARPLLSKHAIIKMLADAVVSYGPAAKLITEFSYKARITALIPEETTALAFIFDKLIPINENLSDREVSNMCRMLIAALSSCNHSTDAQTALVTEIKAALQRALLLPENTEKHNQIQLVCGLISTMIENCPPTHPRSKNQPLSGQMNNIVRIMLRKGVVTDLARVPHCLDLSSQNFSFTMNAALKPLEALTRIVNQPIPAPSSTKSKKTHHHHHHTLDSTRSATTSTEATNAQGEETAEDTENTDHDVSAVGSSLEANPTNQADETDNLLEIMDQLLERAVNDTNNSGHNHGMDLDDDGIVRYEHERDATEELMSTDSGDSDSNASDQDDDNDDNEADDEDIDVEEVEDNNSDDDENNSSAPNIDRDEDILMIQYADNDGDGLPLIRRNENGFAIPIFENVATGNEPTGSGPITHPLLTFRHSADNGVAANNRGQRINRSRRYQYLTVNPRTQNNPPGPMILQRLLGPSALHSTLGRSQPFAASSFIHSTPRVLIMDNFSLFPSSEEHIDFVDQAGFLFGPSVAATINHVTSLLYWWNEESKVLDVESTYDCATTICNKLIPTLIKHRNAELLQRKQKRQEEEKRSSVRKPKTTDEFRIRSATERPDPSGSVMYTPRLHYGFLEGDRERDANNPQESSSLSFDRFQTNSGEHLLASSPRPNNSSTNEPTWSSDNPFNPEPENGEGQDNSSSYEFSIDSFNFQDVPVPMRPSVNPVLRGNRGEIPTIDLDDDADDDDDEDEEEVRQTVRFFRFPHGDDVDTSPSAPPEDPPPPPPDFEPPHPPRPDSPDSDSSTSDSSTDSPPTRSPTMDSPPPPPHSPPSHPPPIRSPPAPSAVAPPPAPASSSSSSAAAVAAAPPPPVAGPATATASTSTSTDDHLLDSNNRPSTSRGDEIPEGVDPSFLEALPPDMRSEVLEQHRILRLQQRLSAIQNVADATNGAAAIASEVSPEFLAALPPSLQEEVLSQQRLEQQRQAAARANPNEPVDAGAFFETLQPSLRTMILADMEDSQMSALPPDLAAEAQTLRRDWEARNRQLVQERFLQSNLTTIIRHSARGRMGTRFSNFLPQRAQWNALGGRDIIHAEAIAGNVRLRGRQLLDHETLSCLLVLLFVDSPHLNKLRLHRVIRNLCYHGPTREWIIKALLSIIDKSVHSKPEDNQVRRSKRAQKPGPLSRKLMTDTKVLANGANWLNIRMEAALGCHANVFVIIRPPGKRSDRANQASIVIHHQAAPIICRNALDLFISLSKSFPTFLLPLKTKEEKDDKAAGKSGGGGSSKNRMEPTDFWDMLLKLDFNNAKKGKSLAKAQSSQNVSGEGDVPPTSFEQTTFGQLLCMLSSPVIYRSTLLTDNLLRLLSVITMGLPEAAKGPAQKSKSKSKLESMTAPESALSLAVNVLTYKSCSEEGLEYVTTLLLNLANCSLDMSYMILELLLNGAARIGEVVREQIHRMLYELRDLNKDQIRSNDEPFASTSRGILSNRFTKESIVITASKKMKTTCDLQLPSMAPLVSKTASQIFFLRVLRVIVQIRDAIKKAQKKDEEERGKKRTDGSKESQEGETSENDLLGNIQINPLSEQLGSLEYLWDTLSMCLLELEHTPDHHAVLVLQPAVEAFFLVHSPQQGYADRPPTQDAETQAELETSSVRSGHEGEHSGDGVKTHIPLEHMKFLTFAEKHRTVLNQILRQTTAHLADGPFSVLVDHTRVLDFDVKRRYFRTELERLDQGIRREETAVHVRRSNIFEDSFRELYRRSPEEWKNRFYIVFEDEEGQDAGGLLREWYVIISRDIFNPMYALFTVSPGDRVTYMINPASHYNPNHLCYYKFVGRVIAKAIYDNKLLECYFTRSFYKHILGIPVKYTDMESEDYSFYRGLVYLMENNINNLGLDLTFSTEINEFGVTETRDLIANGRNVPVTEDNKMEYVRLSCQMKMTGAIRQQLNAFLEGFYDIIPKRLISIFNEQELELLISGLPNVDIEDLRANTEYHKYQANSLQIQWFWRALRSFDQAERAKFLQFVTGTSKVPLQGFGALEGMNGVQKFQIHRDDRSTDRLPSAHTCFNQLDLPVYETYDKLRAYLLKAIHECSEGFGFA